MSGLKEEYSEFRNEEVETDIVAFIFKACFRDAMVRESYNPVLLRLCNKRLFLKTQNYKQI